MYERFSKELFEAGKYAIAEIRGKETFVLVDTRDDGKVDVRHTIVTLKEDNSMILCSQERNVPAGYIYSSMCT